MYLWLRAYAVKDKYQRAVFISGLVTFVAAYLYYRFLHPTVDAYKYQADKVTDGAMELRAPLVTSVPFNDAYRYLDWLLTVSSMLIEILLETMLDEETFSSKTLMLGVGSLSCLSPATTLKLSLLAT